MTRWIVLVLILAGCGSPSVEPKEGKITRHYYGGATQNHLRITEYELNGKGYMIFESIHGMGVVQHK